MIASPDSLDHEVQASPGLQLPGIIGFVDIVDAICLAVPDFDGICDANLAGLVQELLGAAVAVIGIAETVGTFCHCEYVIPVDCLVAPASWNEIPSGSTEQTNLNCSTCVSPVIDLVVAKGLV